jgi:DNA-binding NtrC family response regulator
VLVLLARALAEQKCAVPLSGDLAHALVLHAWPYNVREVNKIASELAGRGADRPLLEVKLISARLAAPAPPARASASLATRADDDDDDEVADPDRAPAPDKAALEKMLTDTRGSVSEIARVTGRSRRQVRRWLEKHGLDADAYRK